MTGATPLRVVVAGPRGRLGSLVVAAVEAAGDLQLVGTLDRGDEAEAVLAATRPDVLLDVSLAQASRVHAPRFAAAGVAVVVGTSGLDDEDRAALAASAAAGGVGVRVVPNFSVGAVLQMRAAEQAARWLRCEGVAEVHHVDKRDSPSGTALATAARIAAARPSGHGAPPPIHSDRRADVTAEQSVAFSGEGERLELRHAVSDRRAYLPGALLCVRGAPATRGLVIGMDDLLDATV